jgi:hypothetical protein
MVEMEPTQRSLPFVTPLAPQSVMGLLPVGCMHGQPGWPGWMFTRWTAALEAVIIDRRDLPGHLLSLCHAVDVESPPSASR